MKIPRLSELPKERTVDPVVGSYVPSTGVYYNTPFSEYCLWDCFNKSAISEIKKTGAHYQQYRKKQMKSKAIDDGKLLDCLVLEPDEFSKNFAVPPKTWQREKKVTRKDPRPGRETLEWSFKYPFCQQWKKDQQAKGLTVVTDDQINTAVDCMKVMATKETVRTLLGGKTQVSMVWDDPITGVRCKGRLDVLNDGKDQDLTDLKKTKDASWNDDEDGGFKKEIYNYGYHIQAALYQDGWEVLTGDKLPFNFVAVEFFPPYECAAYAIREDSLLQGRIAYRKAQFKYRDMMLKGKYDGYPDKIIDLDVPAWGLQDVNYVAMELMEL